MGKLYKLKHPDNTITEHIGYNEFKNYLSTLGIGKTQIFESLDKNRPTRAGYQLLEIIEETVLKCSNCGIEVKNYSGYFEGEGLCSKCYTSIGGEVKEGKILNEKQKEKFEQTNDYIKAERLITRKPQTLEECAKEFDVDLNIWECVKFSVSNWDVTSTKKEVTATNYSVKAEFKKKSFNIKYEDMVRNLINDIQNDIPKYEQKSYMRYNSGNMLEIPIMDLHLAKLAWKDETGEDYDSKIAEERFLYAIQDLLERAKDKKLEKIVFPIGNDFFNFDTINGTTTKGTHQDNDSRWQKMFKTGCNILVKGIDMLSEVAPVEVMYIPANHDYQTSYYAIMYLYAWYSKNNDVSIDISPKPRKYMKWGDCLVGWSHGNEEGKRIGNIMQIEARKEWGDSKYCEFHLAHLHSEQTTEIGGIIIRNISSVTSTDAWHSRSGYIGAVKKAQSFLWNKEHGLLTIENSPIKVGGL